MDEKVGGKERKDEVGNLVLEYLEYKEEER